MAVKYTKKRNIRKRIVKHRKSLLNVQKFENTLKHSMKGGLFGVGKLLKKLKNLRRKPSKEEPVPPEAVMSSTVPPEAGMTNTRGFMKSFEALPNSSNISVVSNNSGNSGSSCNSGNSGSSGNSGRIGLRKCLQNLNLNNPTTTQLNPSDTPDTAETKPTETKPTETNTAIGTSILKNIEEYIENEGNLMKILNVYETLFTSINTGILNLINIITKKYNYENYKKTYDELKKSIAKFNEPNNNNKNVVITNIIKKFIEHSELIIKNFNENVETIALIIYLFSQLKDFKTNLLIFNNKKEFTYEFKNFNDITAVQGCLMMLFMQKIAKYPLLLGDLNKYIKKYVDNLESQYIADDHITKYPIFVALTKLTLQIKNINEILEKINKFIKDAEVKQVNKYSEFYILDDEHIKSVKQLLITKQNNKNTNEKTKKTIENTKILFEYYINFSNKIKETPRFKYKNVNTAPTKLTRHRKLAQDTYTSYGKSKRIRGTIKGNTGMNGKTSVLSNVNALKISLEDIKRINTELTSKVILENGTPVILENGTTAYEYNV